MAEVHQAMEENHHYEFDPPDPIRGRLDFLDYLRRANVDYKKYHADGANSMNLHGDFGEHDELCSWCNYHSAIYDAILNITDYDTCKANSGDQSCEECLSDTTWYKKL